MVYACFVAKMSKMAFTRFGGQFQFEKSMLGRLDNSGAGETPGSIKTQMRKLVPFESRLPNCVAFWILVVVPGNL